MAPISGWPAVGRRNRSMRIVRSTRSPSRNVLRLLVPWMRGYSKLGTSAMLAPAMVARTWISVSTSNPSPQSRPPSAGRGETASRPRVGTRCRQKTLYP
jgi:hypothetical protein